LEKVLGLLSMNLFEVTSLVTAYDLIYAFRTCQGDLSTILHLQILLFQSCYEILDCIVHFATRENLIR